MIICYWRKLRKPKNNIPSHGKYETAAERRVLAANRRLAQLVEHLSYTQQVAGSNPASPIWLERIINRADCGNISAKRKHLKTGAFLNTGENMTDKEVKHFSNVIW